MKLTRPQAISLLQQIIPDVVLVDTESDGEPEFDASKAIQAFLDSREPVFRKKFDDETLPNLKIAIAGQFGGKLKQTIKKLSGNALKESDLKDLNDEDAVKALVTHLQGAGTSDVESLRSKIEKMADDHQLEIDRLKAEHQGELIREKDKVMNVKKIEALTSMHSKFPLPKGNDNVRATSLQTYLESKYATVYNETTGKYELREKDNTNSPVIVDGKVLSAEDAAKEYYEGIGLWRTDKRDEVYDDSSSRSKLQDDPNFEKMLPHQQDLAAALDAIG